ncbi:LOG family protein [Sphingobacterium daejeonense]|uniref:LOG family protein n=1 Tax=Sphingobacterium daejeonense TaxID=371142 RepID=UPI0010C47D1E|nr:LOG family protein [Sphingobacterium daejeonense]VTP98685.1 Possible lysine decarboxylase [Sphingobacterium daejeonense]
MPGGFGTLDEFFETLTLIQTKKISQFPIVVMGMDFHQNIKEHVDRMIIEKTISPEDQDLLLFTDDIQEAAGTYP